MWIASKYQTAEEEEKQRQQEESAESGQKSCNEKAELNDSCTKLWVESNEIFIKNLYEKTYFGEKKFSNVYFVEILSEICTCNDQQGVKNV